jgi:hypothetical protein
MAGMAAGERPPHSQPAQSGASRKEIKMDGMSQPALLDVAPKRRKPAMLFNPKEFKLVSLRECPTPAEMQLCDTPDKAAAYWREYVPGHPYFNRDVECFVVLLLNTRRKVQGHCLISMGTLDTTLVHLPGASPEPPRSTSDRRLEISLFSLRENKWRSWRRAVLCTPSELS